MRTGLHFIAIGTTLTALALGGCGDDSSGSGGSSSSGTGGAASSAQATGPTTSTSNANGPSSSDASTSDASTSDASTSDASTSDASTSDTSTTTSTGDGGAGGAGTGGSGTGGLAEQFVPLWTDTAYLDDAGRFDTEPFVNQTLVVRPAGTEDPALFQLDGASLPEGFVVHAYAVGRVADDTLDAYIVQDNGADFSEPGQGDGNLRLAHFAPDLPALDVYLYDESEGLIYGPLLDTDQFEFPSMSLYGSFPAAEYEALVLPYGGEPFFDEIAQVPGLSVVDGGSHTLAIVGDEDTGYDVRLYADDVTEPAEGMAAATFVHVAPDMAAVDTGLLIQE